LRGDDQPADARLFVLLHQIAGRTVATHQQHREFELVGIATEFLGHVLYLGNALASVLDAEPARAPSIGIARNPFERVLWVVRPEQYRRTWFLHRLGTKLHRWELHDLARVADIVATPQRA